MALVTISGFPCSGKTTAARALERDFTARLGEPSYKGPRLRVVVVDDESNHVPRSTYDDSKTEKHGRGNVFTAVTRHLGPDTIVICDSPNYIKGFRYQMYCAAREALVRVCTIHTATPPGKCKERHAARPPKEQYNPSTFDNLISRYEEPSSMTRWDSPLFVIPQDESPPFDAIWSSITTGAKAPPPAAVAPPPRAPVNALQVLTGTTSGIVRGLLAHLAGFPGSGEYVITMGASVNGANTNTNTNQHGLNPTLHLHLPTKTLTLPEMQRLKRQFENVQIKAHTSGAKAQSSWTEQEVASKFVAFLEATWGT